MNDLVFGWARSG